MSKKSYPLAKVYGLLEPGPVVLLTTSSNGHSNIMTLSWHTMIDFDPPLVGCVISNNNFSFGLLNTTMECVINIPTVDIIEKVVGCGNSSGVNIDKFERFQLTAKSSSNVVAPLIDECFASLECRVVDTGMVCLF